MRTCWYSDLGAFLLSGLHRWPVLPFVAEISVSSPRKLFFFHYLKKCWINIFEKGSTAVGSPCPRLTKTAISHRELGRRVCSGTNYYFVWEICALPLSCRMVMHSSLINLTEVCGLQRTATWHSPPCSWTSSEMIS